MKRILLMLVLLIGVVTSAWAEKTPQATSDVNGDGFITSVDVTVIYNILLGSR